jgi:tetratricopeptide (TPR) repeat protein
MMKKLLTVWSLFGLLAILVVIVSWVVFPDWRNTPQGLGLLISAAVVETIAVLKNVVSITKDVSDMGSNGNPSVEPKRPHGYTPPSLPSRDEIPGPGFLPPGSIIPFPPNKVFTGRKVELKAIAMAFLYGKMKNAPAAMQVITCMTGIGKTQLAVEFCYCYGRYFQGVHWINARQDIEVGIAACGAEMDLPYWPESTQDRARVTLSAWQKTGPRLIVLDCVDGPELLRDWLPQLQNHRLLMTTRRHDWPPDINLQIHRLDWLTPLESVALLRKLAPRLENAPETETDLAAIANWLGNLPLAIYLAGRHLNARWNLTPRDYLDELKVAGGALANTSLLDWVEGDCPTDQQENLTAAFLLNWQHLNSQEPNDARAIEIFCACGYCAPNTPIPFEIFTELIGDKLLTSIAINRLLNLGLLNVGELEEKDITIHQLLAEFARLQDNDKLSLKKLEDVLVRLSYAANTIGRPAVFAPLRPHIERVAEKANEMNMYPDDLFGNLGIHYRIVAEYEKAMEANKQALTIDETVYGPQDTRTALRLNNLGRVFHAINDLKGAKKYYQNALHIDKNVLGRDHPTVALRLNNFGMILKDLGSNQRARMYIERALAIDEKAYGQNHPSVARDITNLGWVLKDLGKLDEALNAFRRARQINEQTYGVENSKVARDITNMGWVLKDLGKLDEALDAFNQACNIDEKALGPDHPEVASDIYNSGWVLKDQGKPEKALDAFKRSCDIDKKAFGPNHPVVARDITSLGWTFKDLRKFKEALDAFRQVRNIDEKVFGPAHSEVASDINNIGGVLLKMGKLEDAIQHFKLALSIDENIYGADHLAIARDLYNIGLGLKDRGNLRDAKQHIEQALRICERSLPAAHPHILQVHMDLEIINSQITNPRHSTAWN